MSHIGTETQLFLRNTGFVFLIAKGHQVGRSKVCILECSARLQDDDGLHLETARFKWLGKSPSS
jgi:hypothetical protein